MTYHFVEVAVVACVLAAMVLGYVGIFVAILT